MEEVDHSEVVTGKVYSYRLRPDLMVTVKKHDITSEVPPNEEVKKHVESCDAKIQQMMKKVVSVKKILFKVIPEINLKFSFIRTNQSILGSLFCDLIRKDSSADCSLLSSGSLRADRLFAQEEYYSFGDLFDIYPFYKELCLIEISGEDIYKALECGVSKYPALEGRFPQVNQDD